MHELRPWIPSATFFGISAVVALIFNAALVRRLRAWARQNRSTAYDLVVESIVGPLPVWIALAGLAGAAQSAPISPKHVLLVHKSVVAVFLISLTVAASRLASASVREYSKAFRGAGRTTGVVETLAQAVVLIVGGLLILTNLGISIAPLLGALGVGSLAVALALQDTLGNLFAGLHIVASEIAAVGDYVRLDSGQEGTVTDIGWRVTRILDGAGNDVILPNSKLANAVVINFHKPLPDTVVPVELSVAYGSDLDQVERVTLEVAREVQRTAPKAKRDHEPSVRYKSFDDSAIGVTVGLKAESFPDRGPLVHDFIKRIHARYAKEGIDIPFPQRVVHLKQAA